MAVAIDLWWCIVILITVLFSTIVGFLAYSGLIHPIDVGAGKPPFKELLVAYKFSRGSYKQAGALFTECYNIAPKLRCIGVYYDDPNEVAAKDLRYIVGLVVAEGDDVKSEENKHYLELLTGKGFKMMHLPNVSHSINVQFPFRTSLSIFIAISRVYPKLGNYIQERGLCAHPMIELYDVGTIHFVAPLAKQDEFYVPEALVPASDSEEFGDSATDNQCAEASEIEEVNLPAAFGDATPDDALLNSNNSPHDSESKEGSVSNGEESAGSSFEEIYGDNDIESDKN